MAQADWCGAKEAGEMKENQPLASVPLAIATLLAILGSAANSPTLSMTPGYPVKAHGCPCVRAVPPPLAPDAVEVALGSEVGPGLAARFCLPPKIHPLGYQPLREDVAPGTV